MLVSITPVTAAIKHLTSIGATERQLLAAVVQRFPEQSPAELRFALQEQRPRRSGMPWQQRGGTDD